MFGFEAHYSPRFSQVLLIPIIIIWGMLALSCGAAVLPVDVDGDGFSLEQGDCNGEDASTYPGAIELCDGLDNNCDGLADADVDGDGFLACFHCVDGVKCGDCNDGEEGIHPGAAEICDGQSVDENCNGLVNDDDPDVIGTIPAYADGDGDGYGSESESLQVCALPDGYVALGGDCNDEDKGTYPGAPEACEGIIEDSNCDGILPSVGVDSDGDGWTVCALDGLGGTEALPEDCNDSDTSIHPGASEICDGLDNDCNALADDPTDLFDEDGDGTSDCIDDDQDGFTEKLGDCDDLDRHNHPGAPEYADNQDNDCDSVIDEDLNTSDGDSDGFSRAQGDCDDFDPRIYPGAGEICDGVDNDCDGLSDESVVRYWYVDRDADGYGGDLAGRGCSFPDGAFSETDGDCDDGDASIHPGAPEVCDGLDNDCDGSADGWPDEPILYYPDADGDGYGASDVSVPSGCEAPSGYVSDSTDCDDDNPRVNPGIPEVCADELDQDCDGIADDGCSESENLCLATGGEWVFGCVPKTCVDPCGDECTQCVTEEPICQCPEDAPLWDERLGCMAESDCVIIDDPDDADGDGFPVESDCNDEDPDVNPGATEICRNGIDDNCDGAVDEDPCRAS